MLHMEACGRYEAQGTSTVSSQEFCRRSGKPCHKVGQRHSHHESPKCHHGCCRRRTRFLTYLATLDVPVATGLPFVPASRTRTPPRPRSEPLRHVRRHTPAHPSPFVEAHKPTRVALLPDCPRPTILGTGHVPLPSSPRDTIMPRTKEGVVRGTRKKEGQFQGV